MKLASLVNLKPLKEDLSRASMEELEALARQAQDIQDSEAGYAQQQGDFDIDKFGNEFSDQKVMPYGGEYYSMNDIQDAINNYYDRMPGRPYHDVVNDPKYKTTVAPDKDTFTKSSKFDRMNETTEDAWKAIDVSKKAEKALNKELGGTRKWNERTAKKLAILKDLNKAGKFKKDFDDERLQGWVDQNYSWEKVSRQFKLNESYSEMYEQGMYIDDDEWEEEMGRDPKFGGLPMASKAKKPNLKSIADVDRSSWTPDGGGGSIGYMEYEDGTEMTPQEIQDYFEVNHELYDDIMQGLYEMKVTDKDGKDVTSDVIKKMEKSLEKAGYKFTKGYTSDPDLRKDDPRYTKAEGSCGYGPDGVPGDTPGDTQGMDADDRTRGMLRKLIQKEIAKLSKESKEGPDHGKTRTSPSGTKFKVWDKDTDMMGNPRGTKRKDKNMQGGPLRKGNVNYREGENQSLDSKLKGLFSDKEWEKITNKPVPSFADLKPKSKEKK